MIGIAVAVDPFMVMSHKARDLLVVVDLRENVLPNYWMLLHESPLLKRQRTWLLEETGGESDLADVMHEPAKVRHLRLLN